MGATSVTGISGDNKGMGSAEGSTKGTERTSMGVEKLIGPHTVYCNSGTLVGGALTIEFPTLPGVASDYVAQADSLTGNRAYVSSMTTSTVVIAGTGTDAVSVVITKKGKIG